jgi:hypothetical protein
MKYDNGLIRWSKIATVIFLLMVVVADVCGVWISQYVSYCWAAKFDTVSVSIIATIWYLGTVGGYAILGSVYKLLNNMSKDIVFDRANTTLMNYITIALIGIGVVCVVGGFVWFGCWFLTIISLFMALVVSCVKVVFDKAITMKEEMDLTI